MSGKDDAGKTRAGTQSPAELAETYDAIAQHWDATRTRPWPQTLAFLKGGRGRLLDIGCGTGRNAEYASDQGWEVTAVDCSKGQLEVAEKRLAGLGVALVCADCNKLPFPDALFDAFISIAVIHHLDSEIARRAHLAEAGRVLKEGGRGLVSAWSVNEERFRGAPSRDLLVPWKMHDGRVFDRYYHLFDQPELERLCAEAGFSVEKGEETAGNCHCWVVKP